MDFCQSQHSKGLVTYDTEEKYLDVKRIVGPDGENSWAFTALYNPTGTRCTPQSNDGHPTCSSLLVRSVAIGWFLCLLWDFGSILISYFRDGNPMTACILHSPMAASTSKNTIVFVKYLITYLGTSSAAESGVGVSAKTAKN